MGLLTSLVQKQNEIPMSNYSFFPQALFSLRTRNRFEFCYKILEVNIMYPTAIPENMLYLFKNADYLLTEEDYTLLEKKHNRAKNLKENNGALYPGFTQSAVVWLAKAYDAKTLVKKQAFDDVIEHLSKIHIKHFSNIQKPSRY